MKKIKRLASILLCVLLAVPNIIPVLADESGIYTYTVSGNYATITSVSTSASGELIVPETLGGYTVTAIDSLAFYNLTNVTSITLPDTVTTLGRDVFRECTSLEYIDFGSGVETIGRNCLYNCYSLTTVTLSEALTALPDYMFYSCVILESVTIPEGVTSIGTASFLYCLALDNVTIPDTVTSIGDSAFYGCSSLTQIAIPSSVESIGNDAFCNCTALTSVSVYNYECEIYYSESTFPSTATILGYANSTTQEYCDYYGYEFEALPCDHPETAYIEAVAATCTEDGWTESTYCPICGTVFVEAEVVPATGHSYGDYALSSEPDSLGYYYTASVCSNCGDSIRGTTYVDSVAITLSEGSAGDTFTLSASVKTIFSLEYACASGTDGTFASTDSTESQTLTTYTDGVNIYYSFYIRLLSAAISSGYVLCDEVSIIVNGETVDCDVVISGNTITVTNYVTSYHSDETSYTYTSDTHSLVCSGCGDVISTEEHSYSAWTVSLAATATTDGYRSRVCSVCGYTQTEVISATGTTDTDTTDDTDSSDSTDTDTDDTIIDTDSSSGEELEAYSDSVVIAGNYILVYPGTTIPTTDELSSMLSGGSANGVYTGAVYTFGSYTYTIILLGDTDANGAVEMADARAVLRAATSLELLSTYSAQLAADVDDSSDITLSDARSILRYALSLSSSL